MDTAIELVKGDKACHWGMKFLSIIGFGQASLVENAAEKREGLDTIMRQYSTDQWEYSQKQLDSTTVFKVEIEEMTGKKTGYL